MATITCENVTKLFGDGTPAVASLDLEVVEGELLVLVGPSGCGKSTTLRMVAGLEQITSGTIRIGDRVVNDLPPRHRDVALVFQNYSLYPHMTVAQNMGFPLRLKRAPREEVRARVEEAARILGLEELLDRKPGTLSGGQRQRVAMGRAIVREPQAFLMDEPLSNLDAQLRTHMRTEIVALQRRLEITTLYVTHDQVEAMTMGHRVAVLNRGVLQQLDTPQALYDRPDNLFVAEFIGSPAMNLLSGTFVSHNSTTTLALGEQELALDSRALDRYRGLRAAQGPIAVGIRPEHLSLAEPGTPPGRCLNGTVTLKEALGSDLILHCRVQAPRVESELVRAATGRQEDVLRNGAGGVTVIARLEPGETPEDGAPVSLAVKQEGLHFFELESGRALR